MLASQSVDNFIQILDISYPDLLLIGERRLRPARFRPIPVVIPLQESNVIVGDEPVQRVEDILLDIISCEIEDKLVAAFGARPTGEGHHPIRMGPVEVAVRIDHFRFDPQPEVHAEAVYAINEWLE